MSDPQAALQEVREAKSKLTTDRMPFKGSVAGMLIGGVIGLALKRNVITFALLGALAGGALNVLRAKIQDDEQE